MMNKTPGIIYGFLLRYIHISLKIAATAFAICGILVMLLFQSKDSGGFIRFLAVRQGLTHGLHVAFWIFVWTCLYLIVFQLLRHVSTRIEMKWPKIPATLISIIIVFLILPILALNSLIGNGHSSPRHPPIATIPPPLVETPESHALLRITTKTPSTQAAHSAIPLPAWTTHSVEGAAKIRQLGPNQYEVTFLPGGTK